MFRFKNLIFALVPVVILISLRLHLFLPCEGDKGWLLHASRQWLEGAPLYIKVFEVNPPLILWIYAIPVWLSVHMPWMTDYEALGGMGIIASAFSVAVGTRVIAFHPAFEEDRGRRIKFAFLQALVFIFYTTQAYFFDREHILIVMAFPYMLRFMPQVAERRIPVRLSAVIGGMAAIGFCIKPHGMLIFAVLQIFALWRTHSPRSLLSLENAIIVVFTAMYLFSIWIFTPEYIRTVLPMAVDTYETFRNADAGYTYLPPFFIGIGLMFADFRPWHETPFRKDVYYFAGLCFAFFFYAKINNGWGYTYNPLYCMLTFTAAWMLWEYDWLRQKYQEQDLSARQIYFGLRGCFIVLMAHAAYMVFYLALMNYHLDAIRTECKGPDCWRNAPYEQYFQDHHVKTFGTISFEFSNWVSLMRMSHTDWVTRFNHLWMLPKLLLAGDAYMKDHYWIVDYVGRGLAEDLNNNRPDVVLVDSSPSLMGLPRTFNLPMTLSGVPEFKEAWSHYQYRTRFNACGPHMNKTSAECLYDLYGRIP